MDKTIHWTLSAGGGAIVLSESTVDLFRTSDAVRRQVHADVRSLTESFDRDITVRAPGGEAIDGVLECGGCGGAGHFSSGFACSRCKGTGVQNCEVCPSFQPKAATAKEHLVAMCPECAADMRRIDAAVEAYR